VALTPYPVSALARRAFHELDARHAVFDLPARKFVTGDPARDLSIAFHDARPSSPFGPAAGPHTQLAQNIVLSWLVGGRVIELKTVQVRDDLHIPRPCIDMETVGFNVEWSQELRLDESLAEYAKASLLVRMLVESGKLPLAPGFDRTVLDVSVGYDLAGISSDRIVSWLRAVRDAALLIDRLRRELPADLGSLRDVDVPSELSRSVTLSTFHGCPSAEIERIVAFLVRQLGFDCIVKLNPTLLGAADTRRLLGDVLGYRALRVPDEAFANDLAWDDATGLVERLSRLAADEGRGFGVKLTNTLVVENHKRFFPSSERLMYLSGQPLHVLAVEIARRFRRHFGDRIPISFSAGVDRANFADVVALGFAPVTACTDLLRPGGYGRARSYFQSLSERMAWSGARSIDEWVIRGLGQAERALDTLAADDTERAKLADALHRGEDLRAAAGDEVFRQWRAAAACANLEAYADRVAGDPRYHEDHAPAPPRKVGRRLWAFDCLSCDKCLPVCPNHAIFTFRLAHGRVVRPVLQQVQGEWRAVRDAACSLAERHQIAIFDDFCNDCGNCDVFCPEDGGPNRLKPRFFGTEAGFRAASIDGFYVDLRGGGVTLARLGGEEYRVEVGEVGPALVCFDGPGFSVVVDRGASRVISGHAEAGVDVDLLWLETLTAVADAVRSPAAINWITSLEPSRLG
jgi:putative selenate reductase